MPPDLVAYRTLLALVDCGGVQQAAKRLRCPQPQISRRLAQFQRPPALLEHQGRNLALTTRGNQLLPAIRDLVRRYDEVNRGVRDDPPRNTVLLGTGRFLGEYVMPEVLAALAKDHPEVRVHLRMARGQQRVLDVAEGRLDAALVTHSQAQVQAIVAQAFRGRLKVDCQPLAAFPLCVVAKKGSDCGRSLAAWAEDRPLPLKRLAELPLVGLDPDSGVRRQLEQHFQADQSMPRFVVEGGDWHVALAYVRAGLGVAIVPWLTVARAERTPLVMRRLPAALQVQESLVVREGLEPERLFGLPAKIARAIAGS